MSENVGRIDLDLGINYKQFNNQLSGISGNATNMVGGAFKKLGLIIAGAFAVKEMIGFGREAIKLASDLNEVQNVVDVTFGAMAGHVDAFAKSALTSFGLSELSAKRMASTMGAMLKSSGLTGNAVVQLSESMTGLAADFASFYNLNQQDAFDKIRSGISGETEPLKQLGINMSVANLQAFALSQGITKSYMSMSQAEQVLLRYNYLLKTSKDAQGDFARTSNSWANQTRLLSEQWKIFQGTMGQGFINILTPVLRGLNWLIAKLQIAAQYFKAFTEMLFGSAQTASAGAAAVAGAGTAASDAGGSMDDMGQAAGGAGKATKKAGKEIKGALAGFDQLNTISQSAAGALDDAAGGMGAIGGGMGNMKLGDISAPKIGAPDMSAFKPVLNFLDNVKTESKKAGQFLANAFGPSLKHALGDIMPPLLDWKKALWGTFNDLSGLGAPLKKWFTTDLVTLVQQGIVTYGHVLGGLLDTTRQVFSGLSAAVMPIFQAFVTNGLPMLTQMATGAIQVFQSIFDSAKFIFDTLWTGVIQPDLMLLSQITVDTLGILKDTWDKYGQGIIDGLVLAFDNIKKLFNDLWVSFLQPIVTNMLAGMKSLWDNHLKALVAQIMDVVGKLAQGALDIFNKFIVPVTSWLIKNLGPAFATVFKGVGDILLWALGIVADVAKGIFKALGGVIDFIVGVFTGDWKKAWGGVKTIFSGIFDSIGAILKAAINLIIDGVNVMIRGLNKIHMEVPDWVPGIGGKGFKVSIPTIPKLAGGGLVDSPTLAMVGDNKNARVDPEVISPLSKLQDMITRTIAEAMAAMGNNSRDDVPTEIVLKLGETELGRAVIKAINSVHRQTGKMLLNIN